MDVKIKIRLRKINGIVCHELIIYDENSGTQLVFSGDSKNFQESLAIPIRLYSLLGEYISKAKENWEKAKDFNEEGMEDELFNNFYEREESIEKIFAEIKGKGDNDG